MVAPLQLGFDPTPSSVEEIAQRLPPSARAGIQWFPQALRSTFIEPLRRAPRERFRKVLDEVTVDAARVLLRLLTNIGAIATLFQNEELARALEDDERERSRHELIARQLEPIDVAASDDLREAYEWLRAVLAATTIALRAELVDAMSAADATNGITDEQIQSELGGEGGTFLRGVLLTIGALDLILERQPLPDSISTWCRHALEEMHTTATLLRARGVSLPTHVCIPGLTAEAWRARREAYAPKKAEARLLELHPRVDHCPPGVIEHIVEVLKPEEVWLFGSHARGTARPESDWDLLVVVPDATTRPLDRMAIWNDLPALRRQRVDIFPMRASEFEADRNSLGTLAHVAFTEGYLVYGG